MAKTFHEIMSPTLFYNLLFCSINTATVFVSINMNNLFSMATFISLEGIIIITSPTFFYCSLSEVVTSELFSIGDYFYGIAWYRLPVKQQQFLRLPIQRSQKEFRLKGFGLMSCSLMAFIGVRVFCCSRDNFLNYFQF